AAVSLTATLLGYEAHDVGDGIEILRQHFAIGHLDAELLLEKHHDFQDAGRVDDSLVKERVGHAELSGLAKQEVLADVGANLGFNRHLASDERRLRQPTRGCQSTCFWPRTKRTNATAEAQLSRKK